MDIITYIAALQNPCQENFWKFQVSGESRFGSSENDRYFLKLPKWQHNLLGIISQESCFFVS